MEISYHTNQCRDGANAWFQVLEKKIVKQTIFTITEAPDWTVEIKNYTIHEIFWWVQKFDRRANDTSNMIKENLMSTKMSQWQTLGSMAWTSRMAWMRNPTNSRHADTMSFPWMTRDMIQSTRGIFSFIVVCHLWWSFIQQTFHRLSWISMSSLSNLGEQTSLCKHIFSQVW